MRNTVYRDERVWILKELATARGKLVEEEAAYDAMILAEPPE